VGDAGEQDRQGKHRGDGQHRPPGRVEVLAERDGTGRQQSIRQHAEGPGGEGVHGAADDAAEGGGHRVGEVTDAWDPQN
jgi:hypothetical protein